MTNTYVSVMITTASGQNRIFAADVTDSASTYGSLTDIVTGNTLGDSLQGQTITSAMGVCENTLLSPGVIFVDNNNNIVGSVGAGSPEQSQPQWQSVNIPIQLNYTCKALTSASVA
jgi:hypothetical protein